ncbi:hypothetical protein VTN31DRAFT_5840 [Thermomyces dupontii]|uniref:uncharacterized protein n=1 Tax=Talaromyces thermophilus TaxID=28565 RepID=UPI003743024B
MSSREIVTSDLWDRTAFLHICGVDAGAEYTPNFDLRVLICRSNQCPGGVIDYSYDVDWDILPGSLATTPGVFIQARSGH